MGTQGEWEKRKEVDTGNVFYHCLSPLVAAMYSYDPPTTWDASIPDRPLEDQERDKSELSESLSHVGSQLASVDQDAASVRVGFIL